MTNSWCVGGCHYSNTNKTSDYEKRSPKNKKFVKIIKRKCNVCGRNESQILSST